jgi:hypothetical protein
VKAAAVIVLAAVVVASGCGKSPSEADAFNPVGTVSFGLQWRSELSAGGVPAPAAGAAAYRPD